MTKENLKKIDKLYNNYHKISVALDDNENIDNILFGDYYYTTLDCDDSILLCNFETQQQVVINKKEMLIKFLEMSKEEQDKFFDEHSIY